MIPVLALLGTLVIEPGRITLVLQEQTHGAALMATCTQMDGVALDSHSPFTRLARDGDCSEQLFMFWTPSPVPPGTYPVATLNGCPFILGSIGLAVDRSACGPEPTLEIGRTDWTRTKTLYR